MAALIQALALFWPDNELDNNVPHAEVQHGIRGPGRGGPLRKDINIALVTHMVIPPDHHNNLPPPRLPRLQRRGETLVAPHGEKPQRAGAQRRQPCRAAQ